MHGVLMVSTVIWERQLGLRWWLESVAARVCFDVARLYVVDASKESCEGISICGRFEDR